MPSEKLIQKYQAVKDLRDKGRAVGNTIHNNHGVLEEPGQESRATRLYPPAPVSTYPLPEVLKFDLRSGNPYT